ncbi:MAG TPA: hypothetical protein VFW35_04420 [Sphingomicrobium sp.]|nr:hypothetical protein [Sphingomicrobium sp.]
MRVPWPPDFPDVIIHTDVRARDAHPAYVAAKSGDADAAVQLVIDLINPTALESLCVLAAADAVLILPVTAEEAAGFNAIPDALADHLAGALAKPAALGEIVQTNKVGHTRAKAFQRLVTPPTFDGYVVSGANYLLVDDHVGLGGTLANLRGHVELNGGHVIGMTALTESRDGRCISLRPATLNMLWEKHGEALDELWQAQFGYGIDCLTEVEAQILCRQPTVDAIEDFLAQAAVEARRRGVEAAIGSKGQDA